MSERLNLPSASSFWMDVACPGRQALLKSTPEHIDQSDEMAERGVRIHAALERSDGSNLAEDELEDFSKATAYKDQVLKQWLKEHPTASLIESREERLWLHDDNLNPLLSGQPDVVYKSGDAALVLDFKTGFVTNLTPSDANWQLRVLAVLVRHNLNVNHITVGFIKPKSRYEPADLTLYDGSSLDLAEASIRIALRASASPDAIRIPGKQCRWCQVKHACVEAGGYSLIPTVVAGTGVGLSREMIQGQVQRLSPADWKYLWQRKREIENILDAATQCLKSLNADELKELGLQIGKGKNLDPITNIAGAYEFLTNHLNPGRLWSSLKFNKTALVESIQSQKNLTKKDAQKWVAEQLEPYIEKQKSDGALEEI